MIFPRKRMQEIANRLAAVAATNTSVTILMQARITAGENGFTFAAHDGEMGVVIEEPGPAGLDEFDLLVSATDLAKCVKAAAGESVEIGLYEEKGGLHKGVTIRAGRSTWKLPSSMDALSFPSMAVIEGAWQSAAAIQAAWTKCQHFVSVDPVRQILMGMCVTPEGCAATNTHMLIKTGRPVPISETVVIPSPAAKVLAEMGDSVSFTVGDRSVSFVSSSERVVSQLLAGTFPNVNRVIPQSAEYEVTVNREACLGLLKRGSGVARENADRIRLEFRDGEMHALARNEGNDTRFTESMDITGSAFDGPIALNHRYVIAALEAFQVTEVTLQLTTPQRPVRFVPVGDEDGDTAVVMPMAVA